MTSISGTHSTDMYYCRYGTWNAPSCTLSENTTCVEWRLTPRSKVFKAMLPVVRLPDAYTVAVASNSHIDIEASEEVVDLINTWALPNPTPNQAAVLPIKTKDGVIRLYGSVAPMNGNYQYTDKTITGGDTVAVRVSPNILEIGRGIGQYKLVLNAVDAMILT